MLKQAYLSFLIDNATGEKVLKLDCTNASAAKPTDDSCTTNELSRGRMPHGNRNTLSGECSKTQNVFGNNKRKSNANKSNALRNTNRIPPRIPYHRKVDGTDYVVDGFQYCGCTTYFLTHFHYDHYRGLTSSFNDSVIYSGEDTLRLVQMQLRVNKKFLNALSFNEFTELSDHVNVALIDANHCPGSAMILFILASSRAVLHTGDFRACEEIETHPLLCSRQIDLLYLDTTYCDPRYEFPPQKVVIDECIDLVLKAREECPSTLVVIGSYSVGKERLFIALARALGDVPVFVSAAKKRMLSCIRSMAMCKLTTNKQDSFVHVLSMQQLSKKFLTTYLGTNKKYKRLLAIKPTGWTFSNATSKLEFSAGDVKLYGLPYSEHSSYSELRRFVRSVRPNRIIPTVFDKSTPPSGLQKIFDDWTK